MHTLIPALRPTAALRRLGVRLAFVALLAAALMPTFSRLVQPARLSDWATICQSAASASTTGAPQDDPHEHGAACAFCSLVHNSPLLGGGALPAVAVLAYAPPPPLAPAVIRVSAAQARPANARAPPSVA